jgi:aspartokinase
LAEWGRLIETTNGGNLLFQLVLIQSSGKDELCLSLVFEAEQEREILADVNTVIDKDRGETLDILTPVEMIYFFGPHFGDRYGIADAAVRVLHREAIPLLALACSVSFIYIVLPEGTASQVKACLSENFEIPS